MLTSNSGTEFNNRLFHFQSPLTTKESTIMKNERQPIGQVRPGMRDQTLASVPVEDAAECKTSDCARAATRRAGRTAAVPRMARNTYSVLHRMHPLLIVVTLVAWAGTLAAGERDVVKPVVADKLVSERLTHQELTGSEIDRRIMDLTYKNYMVARPGPRLAGQVQEPH